MLTLAFLNRCRVELASVPITSFPTEKARALLIYLALEQERQHERPWLAGFLWPQMPERSAMRNLSQTLYRLRRVLNDVSDPPWLLVTNQTLQFNPASEHQLDVLAFERTVIAARPGDWGEQPAPEQIEQLAAAATLYRGELLPNVTVADSALFEEWLLLKRERLHQLALNAFGQLTTAALAIGNTLDAQSYAQQQLTLDPWRETAHRQLMEAFVQNGQRTAALRQYERCREILLAELGVEPEPATTTLYAEIQGGRFGAPTEAAVSVPNTISTQPIGISPPINISFPFDIPLRGDWSGMPNQGQLYGRENEMATLCQRLTTVGCRLVVVTGMGGIGKTALAAHAVQTVLSHFTVVIWQSLLNAPTLAELLPHWLQLLAGQPVTVPTTVNGQIDLLLTYLRQERCLLVLDNLETILEDGHSYPTYRADAMAYGLLLQAFGQTNHRGCLFVTSREEPPELARLRLADLPIHTLQLDALPVSAAQSILQERALTNISLPTATRLVEHYSGNALALRLVAETIHELYGGDVATFTGQEMAIFDDIRLVLDTQYARLTSLEQEILTWLAIAREPLNVAELEGFLHHPAAHWEVLQAVRDLNRRSLLLIVGDGFTLQNVIIEYLTQRLVETICAELLETDWRADSPLLEQLTFNRYALLRATAKEYVRQSQERLVLQPVLDQLVTQHAHAQIVELFGRILYTLQEHPRLPGYAAGNLLNLLLQLDLDVSGFDFSQLCVWGAYLRGREAHAIDFTGADLTGSLFSDTFYRVHDLAFSPDGAHFASATGFGAIHLWHGNGEPVGLLTGIADAIRTLAFSPDGRYLASNGEDWTICLWDVQLRQISRRLTGHTGIVQQIIFHPSGDLLASSGRDGTIRLWDLRASNSENPRYVLPAHQGIVVCIAFSPDGALLASGGGDHQICLWDVARGELVATLAGHSATVRALAFHPRATHQQGLLASASWDSTICLWDLATRQPLAILDEHPVPLTALVFSPDGDYLASGGTEPLIRLWSVATRQLSQTLYGHNGWINALAFRPDTQILVSASMDQTIRLWNLPTTSHNQVRPQVAVTLTGHHHPAGALRFQADGSTLVHVSRNHRVHHWDVTNHALVSTQSGPPIMTSDAVPLAWHPSGEMIISGDDAGAIHFWSVTTGESVVTLYGHATSIRALACSADGRLLASGSWDREIRIWDLQQGTTVTTMYGHRTSTVALAFSPDAHLLASGGGDQEIWIWDVQSGTCLGRFQGHTRGIMSLAFHPNGEQLASGSIDLTVRFWRINDHRISPACSSERQDTFILVEERCCLREDQTNSVLSIAFSPDGAWLASAAGDHLITLWDVAEGSLIRNLEGHTGPVAFVAFSADGSTLASSSHDETVRLWDLRSGECLTVLKAPGPYSGMKIRGITGISAAQRKSLVVLGADDR